MRSGRLSKWPVLAGSIVLISSMPLMSCQAHEAAKWPGPSALAPTVPTAGGGMPSTAASSSSGAGDAKKAWNTFADSGIELTVRRKLARSVTVPAQKITASVERGIVTLTGEVETGGQSLRAVQLVETTRGVRAVINRLKISGSSRGDGEITTDLQHALRADLGPDSSALGIEVQAGKVELTGHVHSLAEKRGAERAAWRVYGVTGVDDQIQVKPDTKLPDSQIAANIQERLSSDTLLNGQHVGVSVEGGVATLSGEVDSAFAKQRARDHATVSGVTAIRDEALSVSTTEHAHESPITIPSGEQARSAILDSFRLDPRVPNTGIEVAVQSGQVKLTGAVATLAQKIAASEDAVNAAGTWIVSDFLRIEPGAPFTDEQLQKSVATRLREHPYVTGDVLQVAVRKGVVVLSGDVASDLERREAERVAGLEPGVMRVEDRTQVRTSSQNIRDDQDIRRDLEHELAWDPRVDPSKVSVQVENGTATVSGVVGSWEVRNAVLEDVFEVQPHGLVDHLRVPPPAKLLWSR